MLDTLKLQSPGLTEEVARAIEAQVHTKSDVDNATGEMAYCVVSGSPAGSWEICPHVNVFRTEFYTYFDVATARTRFQSRECAPYVVVEGSVHKAMLGHNVFGGPCDVLGACRWYVGHLGRLMGVSLPDGALWRVLRADWAEAYDLGSYEAVSEFLHGLSLARYPRRKVQRYGDETVSFVGAATSFKFYHKGPEFSRHDFKRIERTQGHAAAVLLQGVANGILRVESSIKNRKLKAVYGENPPSARVGSEQLSEWHDLEVVRVLREGQAEMETVRTALDVRSRLMELYGNRKGGLLYATWVDLSTLGEDVVRSRIPVSTWYRHRKELSEAGVSWSGTDVMLREHASLIPRGFSPVRSDPRRLVEVAPVVQECLRAYA